MVIMWVKDVSANLMVVNVLWLYICVCVYQIIALYTLNLHKVLRQLYLSQAVGEKDSFFKKIFIEVWVTHYLIHLFKAYQSCLWAYVELYIHHHDQL